MTTPQTFTERERERFRKLLEVANSTTYEGEKDAALAAATRLARSRGMSLHEAAGMSEPKRASAPSNQTRRSARRHDRDHDFGETFKKSKTAYRTESERLAAEKRHYEKAMADAVKRGLRLDDEDSVKKRPPIVKRSGSGSWRSRPDFIRVLLRETRMSVREIASTAGVSIHDVFKEKLLMRQA